MFSETHQALARMLSCMVFPPRKFLFGAALLRIALQTRMRRSSLSGCCCCNSGFSKLRLSGRRQEIRVTLATAVPCLLSVSNDVVWLEWRGARNSAIAEVRKIGQCLYCSCTWEHAASICFLPIYTVSLSVFL